MHSIQSNGYQVEIGSLLESSFRSVLQEFADEKIVILVDENTQEHCLSFLITNFEELSHAEVLMIPVGEASKSLEIAGNLWQVMTEFNISRYDLLINLGGGVVTDLGGFIASCYKRGVEFINVPTTLLGMVDASVGGKTGINLGHYKNQIGVFSVPRALYVDPIFLETLPEDEMLSGYGEMIKHALVSTKPEMLESILNQMESPYDLSEELLMSGIQVKNEIVSRDPLEKGERKLLNFGHTVGHAIEGHAMHRFPLKHGHAIAIGMVFEAYIALRRKLLPQKDFQRIETAILSYFSLPEFTDTAIREMVSLLSNDKKNRSGKILACLPEKVGVCSWDHEITEQEVMEAFLHYKNQQINMN